MKELQRAGSDMRNRRRVGGSQLASHMVSSLFVRTSHKRLRQWHWNGWSWNVEILNIETLLFC